MRKCLFKLFEKKDNKWDYVTYEGKFHQWGVDATQEQNSSCGEYSGSVWIAQTVWITQTVGVVERPDGTIVTPLPTQIQFIEGGD